MYRGERGLKENEILTCSEGAESESEERDEAEELDEYFLDFLAFFLEDFLEDFFFSNLFFSFVEVGLESRSTGDRGLLACLDGFFLCFVV